MCNSILPWEGVKEMLNYLTVFTACNFLSPKLQHFPPQFVDLQSIGVGHCRPLIQTIAILTTLATPFHKTATTSDLNHGGFFAPRKLEMMLLGVEAGVFCSNGLLADANKQPHAAHTAMYLPQKRCIHTRSSRRCVNSAYPI